MSFAIRNFILFLSVVLICSCTKTEPLVPGNGAVSYPEGWVGEYIGNRTVTSWSIDNPSSSNTILDTVVVSIDADSNYYIDQTWVALDSTGLVFMHSGGSNYYSATFSGIDSLNVSTGSGGLGGGTTSSFYGVKR